MSDKSAPLLFALQACPLDAAAAWSLLRLIADICPGDRYSGVDLAIVMRADLTPDLDAIRYASKRFNQTWTLRCPNLVKGWPGGCNTMAAHACHWFFQQEQKHRWRYSGIFLAEADAIPTSREWLDLILAEWRGTEKQILGYHDARPGGAHINGNCIVGSQFIRWNPKFPDSSRDLAWDFTWRDLMIRNAHASRLIFNDYQLGTAHNPLRDEDHLFAPRAALSHPGETLTPAYLHGCKQWGFAHDAVRRRLLKNAVDATVLPSSLPSATS